MEASRFSDWVRLAVTLSGVAWCVQLRRVGGAWQVVTTWGGDVGHELDSYLADGVVANWLGGAAESGRPRTRKLGSRSALRHIERLWVFPGESGAHALLVGMADGRLDREEEAFFRALGRRVGEDGGTDGPAAIAASEPDELMRIVEKIGGLDTAELDLDSVLKRSVERARDLVGGTGAELGLVDGRTGSVRVLWSEIPGVEETQYTLKIGEDVAGSIVKSGQPLWVNDYPAWEGRRLDRARCKAVVGVPMLYRGSVIGTLTVVSGDGKRRYTKRDARLLSLLASQVSISIRNVRLFQELGERIKAQKEAEVKMVETARLAAIGEMAASIAHELNNPLTAITGFSELLLEEFPEGSSQRENMALVLQEARRAREVVRRLLDFSRRETDLKGPVDVTETVSEVLALVQPMAQVQGVEIQFEAWDDLPEIYGDAAQLRQVILNIVTNGIQAMPDGGLLLVQTAIHNAPRQMVSILVRDWGVGIPEAHLDRIFEPFFTTKPVGEGTGLGLSISRNIVVDHGGEILVESVENEGACFSVLLPVRPVEDGGAA